jgi:hypothetical protein
MAATVQNLIKKSFNILLGGQTRLFDQKIDLITGHCGSIKAFLNITKADCEKLVFVIDEPQIKLTARDYEKITALQESGLLDIRLTIAENFVKILTQEFVARQLEMIENMNLASLNINPILAGALNFNNEADLIRYYAYQAISRSVVTSMGFFVQNLILYSSEFVHDGKDDALGEQTKWDTVVEKINAVKAYLEIKSGPNDVNKFVDENQVWNFIGQNDHFINNCIIYDELFSNPPKLKTYTEFINFTIDKFSERITLKSKK